MRLPVFEEFSHMLKPVALNSRVSEWHGFLCGALAADISFPLETSVELLVADSAEIKYTPELNDWLQGIFKTVQSQMTDSNLQFEISLPSDSNSSLGMRVSALASWCDGFLFGLANAGLKDSSVLSGDVQEILQDFSRIAQLDESNGCDDEEEAYYYEIMEFVRIGALLVAEEIQPLKSSEGLH